MKRKPTTPEEQWSAIAGSVRASGAPRLAAVPDDPVSERVPAGEFDDEDREKVRADLVALGMDPDAIGKAGVAFVETKLRELEEAAAPRAVEAREAEDPPASGRGPTSRRFLPRSSFARWTVQVAAAAVVCAALAGATAMVVQRYLTPQHEPTPDRSPPPTELAAQQLRREAIEACSVSQWHDCLSKLDQAKTLDPAGDNAQGVMAQREQATAHIEEQRPKDERGADAGKAPRQDKGPK